METDPSQVRERILSDHRALRGLLDRVEVLAHELLEGRTSAARELREQTRVLEERLREHMALEERILAPALRQADAWGSERVQHFRDDHERQRGVLEQVWRARDDSRGGLEFALIAWGLVRLLREDMASEERISLNERVLRDDPINPSCSPD